MLEARDCTWCGSARSIEHDVCQVCLMRFPEDEEIDSKVVVILEDRDLGVVEVEEKSTGTAAFD